MDDANQLEVPPSFLALFTRASGSKLTEPMAVVRERYELCEDLAQVLTERAAAMQFKGAGDEREVLEQLRSTLAAQGSAVQPEEALWVVRRLAELLGWALPADAVPEPRT